MAHCAFSWGSFASPSENAASLHINRQAPPAMIFERGIQMTWLSEYLTPGLVASVALGIYVGFWITMFVMPLVPNFIEGLTNKPNRNRTSSDGRDYEVSKFGFFTEVLPGRVKIIERGGEFIRCVMSYEDHLFRGEIPGVNIRFNDDDYWEVVETKDYKNQGASDSHPIPWKPTWLTRVFFVFSLPWFVWKRWTFKVTGFVFTGVYPFQKVRTYPLEYFKKVKHGGGEEEIRRVEDYSDHFRVADFQFPVSVPSADTKDKIPVKVFIELMARVFNPYETAYWIDDWSPRLSAATVDGVTHFTRSRYYDNVISILDEGDSRELSESIKKIGNDKDAPNSVVVIGIKISQALVIDISSTRDEDGIRLGEVARARVDRDAAAIRAEGRAAEIRKQAEAVKDNGHIGLAVLAAERNVRTAGAAGEKAIVVIGSGGDVDPIHAAMLQEIKKINKEN